ncbi:MAG: hypothetical protein JXA96_07320 [Sedimentisphaerales bacterium]|nr:hypothetical protein [Sedimentisphaerales bacterium]
MLDNKINANNISSSIFFMTSRAKQTVALHFKVLIFLLLFVFNFSLCSANDSTDEKQIWLVVTRPMFADSLKPLAEKRQSEGFETVISTKSVSEAIESLSKKPDYLLLVGDSQENMDKEPWYLPSNTCQAYKWHMTQGKEFASDSIFGDFDDDMIPDIPVGRLPVRTREQLQLLINKILTFENRPPSLDDLRLPIYTGSADFQPLIDSMTTQFLLQIINIKAAKWLRPWIIAGNETHALCGWPELQAQTFTEELKKGGIMGVFMGHGSINSFFGMNFNRKHLSYTASQAAGIFAEGKPAPPTVIIACNCGNFTSSRSCLAESLLFMPAGPVATIGATTVSHPMTNYFAGMCLLRKPGQVNPANKRLGTLWLDAQKEAIISRDLIMEALLLNIESSIDGNVDAKKVRRDHILMYAFLGDPATKIRMPEPLECKFEQRDGQCNWQVEKPKDATKLYIEIRQDGQSMPPIQLPLEKDSAQKNLQLANDTFAFKRLRELSSDQNWEGIINIPGILRLVTLSPDNIYVTAQKIN